MKIYSNKREGGTHKRKMFWAELKEVLGWRENCFGLKREFFWAEKKGNMWTEKKRKAGSKETKRRAEQKQKEALKIEPG